MEELLYTVPELAEKLKTSQGYIRDLKKAGLMKFLKLGHWKVRASEVERFLKEYEGWDLTDPFKPVPPERVNKLA